MIRFRFDISYKHKMFFFFFHSALEEFNCNKIFKSVKENYSLSHDHSVETRFVFIMECFYENALKKEPYIYIKKLLSFENNLTCNSRISHSRCGRYLRFQRHFKLLHCCLWNKIYTAHFCRRHVKSFQENCNLKLRFTLKHR